MVDTEDELLIVTSSEESSTDEEWEARLEQTQRAQERDAAHDALWTMFRENNIDSKINGLINNDFIENWLRAPVQMEDIIRGNRLKKKNSTVLSYEISSNRIAEFREVAKAVVQFYRPGFARFRSYINDVCASIIAYHYKL
tara:strand:+ start:108 stop:530 length:423 start_codon:yes stop_codon:yes gene_type:complete